MAGVVTGYSDRSIQRNQEELEAVLSTARKPDVESYGLENCALTRGDRTIGQGELKRFSV